MKWNISQTAALSLLLTACGGGRGYSEYAPQTAGPPGSAAAQAWQAPEPGPTSWRTADGTLRTRPAPQSAQPPMLTPEPEPTYAAPPPAYAAPSGYAEPGASYAQPGAAYTPPQRNRAPAPHTAPPPRQQAYAPPAAQPYTPPPVRDGYADPTAGATGPSGSSRPGPGEARYDEIAFAGVRPVAGGAAADAAVVAVHRSLPVNSVVEVTALDTGRTILVLVTGTMTAGDRPMDLSAGAARQLGLDGATTIPVRIRKVAAAPQDLAALRAGQAAAARPDTPPVLLTALRKRLPAGVAAPSYARPPASATARPTTPPRAAPARPATGRGFFVQVAALSNARNAQALAQSMGGSVKQGGGLHRVQLGPFATQREAETARAGAARAGYKDARVFAVN